MVTKLVGKASLRVRARGLWGEEGAGARKADLRYVLAERGRVR